MTQLAELDKMGQEGAKPVDDAEVRTLIDHFEACIQVFQSLVRKCVSTSCIWEVWMQQMYMQVRKIDRKLKACHNPLLDPDSDVYKQRAAAAQQQEQDIRDKKVGVPCNVCRTY